ERFDLAAVVAGCVAGYQAAYPDHEFQFTRGAEHAWVEGVPDSFAQLLDKLIENARDFAPPTTPIRIALETSAREATLSVENDGPPLPEPPARLFQSMVSLRTADPIPGTHLGLGLHI